MPAITTNNLSKQFDQLTAVDRLQLTVEHGQLFGFIGPNGAGKTTTIQMLTGQIQPSSGTATVLGHDPADHPVQVRSEIGILPEREDPPSFLTPREYFDFVADVRSIDDITEQVQKWAERLGFSDKLDTLNKDLSKGEQQKIMITQAFLHEPDLVFIDEPLINLDPVVQERVKEFFLDYQQQGNTIFLSTHVMSLADELCSHIGILDDGKLIALDEKDTLTQDSSLVDSFLQIVQEHGTATADD